MTKQCPMCLQHKFKLRFKIQSIVEKSGNRYSVLTCKACEGQIVDFDLSESQQKRLFSRSFFASPQQKVHSSGTSGETPAMINAQHRVKQLVTRGVKEGCELLEIGSGKGAFVKAASQHFSITGIEQSKDACTIAKTQTGVSLIPGNILTHEFGQKTFDAIVMWDVLACFSDPRVLMEKLSSLLKPGGLLIFTVPSSTSMVSRLMGRFWHLMIPPINMSFYSEKSTASLTSRYNIKMESFSFQSKYVSIGFLLQKTARMLGIENRHFFNSLWIGNYKIPINLFDIATVVCKKNSQM